MPFVTYADDDALCAGSCTSPSAAAATATMKPWIAKLLAARAEKAKLLGFKDWADYHSDDKMLRARPPPRRSSSSGSRRSRGRARRRTTRSCSRRQAGRSRGRRRVADWQKAYLETKVKKARYAADSAEVRKYFVYDKVLAGLLDITSQIYDVQYRRRRRRAPVAPGGEGLRRACARASSSAGSTSTCTRGPTSTSTPRSSRSRTASWARSCPRAALVCNFPRPDPASATPALMEHGDVVTMFHEFGHLLHHVLGGHQKWVRQSGVATEADFVEAPSQMFEEWGWSHETLSRLRAPPPDRRGDPQGARRQDAPRREVRPRHADRPADVLRGDLARVPPGRPRQARSARDGQGDAEEVHAVRLRRGHALPHLVRPPRGLLVHVLHVYVVARDREGPADALREARPHGDPA